MLNISKIKPDFIYRDDVPVAAIIDIDTFNKIIEQLEDDEDVKYLKSAQSKGLAFRDFDAFLDESK